MIACTTKIVITCRPSSIWSGMCYSYSMLNLREAGKLMASCLSFDWHQTLIFKWKEKLETTSNYETYTYKIFHPYFYVKRVVTLIFMLNILASMNIQWYQCKSQKSRITWLLLVSYNIMMQIIPAWNLINTEKHSPLAQKSLPTFSKYSAILL